MRSGTRPVARAAGARTVGGTILTGEVAVAAVTATRLDHLLAVVAAEVEAALLPAAPVAGILAMIHARLPVPARIGDRVGRSVDVEVSVAPVDAAAPIIAARCPAAERVTSPEGDAGRDDAGADIAGRGPVVRRIVRI